MEVPFNHRLSVVLYSSRHQKEIWSKARKKVLKEQPSRTLLIQKDWPLFPYLSLKDQVYLTASGTKKNGKTSAYLEHLKLPSKTLLKHAEQLTLLEKIKLQLLHSLVTGKNQLLLEEVFDQLTVLEIQELLNILKSLVTEEHFSILLFTSDPSIAQSSYIDYLKVVS